MFQNKFFIPELRVLFKKDDSNDRSSIPLLLGQAGLKINPLHVHKRVSMGMHVCTCVLLCMHTCVMLPLEMLHTCLS